MPPVYHLLMSNKAPSVKDLEIPPRKITRWGLLYGLWYVGVPLLMVLAVIDVAMYVLFKHVLDSCYGVFCLL